MSNIFLDVFDQRPNRYCRQVTPRVIVVHFTSNSGAGTKQKCLRQWKCQLEGLAGWAQACWMMNVNFLCRFFLTN